MTTNTVPGISALQCVISSLRDTAHLSDEGGELTDQLRELRDWALSTAAQPPADGALNTIAAMFHSGEEIEGPDGLAIMVDMALWNDALDSFEVIIGDEMVSRYAATEER